MLYGFTVKSYKFLNCFVTLVSGIVITSVHSPMFTRSEKCGNNLKRKGAVKRRSSVPDPEEVAGHLRRLSIDYNQQLQQLKLLSPPSPSSTPSPPPLESNGNFVSSMSTTTKKDEDQIATTEKCPDDSQVDLDQRRESSADQMIVVNENDDDDDGDATITETGSQSESIELSGIDDQLSGTISSAGVLPSGHMRLITSTGQTIDLKPIIDARIEELNRPLSTLTIMTEDESGNVEMITTDVHEDKEVTTIITESIESGKGNLPEVAEKDIDEEKAETLEEALRDAELDATLRRRSITTMERMNKFRPFYGYGSDDDDEKFVPIIQPLRAVDAMKLPNKLEKGDGNNSTDVENIEDDE